MRPEEVTALGDIAGEAAAGLASQIREMHGGIAQRAFKAVGVAAAPVQLAHDQIERLRVRCVAGHESRQQLCSIDEHKPRVVLH